VSDVIDQKGTAMPTALTSKRAVTAIVLAFLAVAAMIAAILPTSGKAGASTSASTCAGAGGSANCFRITSVKYDSDLGLYQQINGSWSSAEVETYGIVDTASDWSIPDVPPGQQWVTLQSRQAPGYCLKAPHRTADVGAYTAKDLTMAALAPCADATKFKIAPASSAGDVRLVDAADAGYCLYPGANRSHAVDYTHGQNVGLLPCDKFPAADYQWRLSGPTTGADANWALTAGVTGGFVDCDSAPGSCQFTPDDPAAVSTVPTGCVGSVVKNKRTDGKNATNQYRYTDATSASHTVGTQIEFTILAEQEFTIFGLKVGGSASLALNAYYDHRYTHADADSATYSMEIPPGSFGWFTETQYVVSQPGTWTFNIGTSSTWSEHFASYTVPSVSSAHPFGHTLQAMVSTTKPTDCTTG
jgi:hypothetical protein